MLNVWFWGKIVKPSGLILVLLLAACDDEASVDMTPFAYAPDMGEAIDQSVLVDSTSATQTVQATFKLLDPVTGRGVSDVTLSYSDQAVDTDAQGEGVLALPEGAYEVRMEKAGVRTHTIFGVAGDVDFRQITYFSSEMITGFVLRSLGLNDDPDKGILVVGLDRPNLSPAIGASASIDVESDAPFVLSTSGAMPGDSIGEQNLGFVSFPNVVPGLVTPTVSFPNGGCSVFPAEVGIGEVTVTGGEVSVIAYTCR